VPHSISGKTAFITGAARGIGAAVAQELARRGASVALVGLEAEQLAEQASSLGAGHLWVEADVTDQRALAAAVEATVERFGGIDVVIANAGVANLGTVHTADPEEAAHTIAVNLVGVYRTAAATVPALAASHGYLLVVASLASLGPLPGGAAYAASKAGVESLAGTLRIELAADGIAVGSLHPSWIDTVLLRDAEAGSAAVRRMRAAMRWPLRTTTSVQDCAVAVADAVERRATRVYVPPSTAVLGLLRPVLQSPAVHRLIASRAQRDLRELDAERRSGTPPGTAGGTPTG
jgi:NAD(P)-dependent dehydrogenase (short-subunit alcohol dehydrogenase family)